MPKIHSSIACNLDSNILLAALPLFQSEKVQAIEWSFDALYRQSDIPPWFLELLRIYSREKRLIGHGVFFSIFSGKWSEEQIKWLKQLETHAKAFQFDHITEHFGFMTGENFHQGAPLSVPFNSTTLSIGIDRLKRMAQACQCPVGLENLAFSYSLEEVKKHGIFLDQLLEPVNGFIILDLHNLYCQMHNFDIDFEAIIQLYPLERVREIHISGGSWEDSMANPEKRIRRDTHDDAVPEAVFQILDTAIDKCPNLKYVVLEQLGSGLKDEESKAQFREDFYRMNDMVLRKSKQQMAERTNHFKPEVHFELNKPTESQPLYEQQLALSAILETASDFEQARNQLLQSCLAESDWKVENWEPQMVETALQIAQKWKNGFA